MNPCIQTDPQTDHHQHFHQFNHPDPMSHGAINASFAAMVEDGIFDPVKRHLDGAHDGDDRHQEALCQVWSDYYSAATRGKPTDRAALVFALKLKAFDVSHRFTRTGHGRRRDVMGAPACVLDEIQVLRLDGLDDEEPGPYQSSQEPPTMSFVDSISYERSRDIENHLISGFDLDCWLNEQTQADRTLLATRYSGGSFEECGRAARVSFSAAHHRLKKLGRELAKTAQLAVPA